MKIEEVIHKGWTDNNRNRKTGNGSFSYRKEEDKFYSYNTEIGSIDRCNQSIELVGLTSEYGNYISQSTSSHFGKLYRYCVEEGLNFNIKILS